jgi:hypothetical protein
MNLAISAGMNSCSELPRRGHFFAAQSAKKRRNFVTSCESFSIPALISAGLIEARFQHFVPDHLPDFQR